MINKVNLSKVSHTQSPSEQFIKEGKEEYSIIDSNGRNLTIKKPNLVDQYRFVAALGDELSSNRTFCAMCNPIRFVTSIDGIPVSRPTNINEIYALIDRVNEEGLMAVVEGIKKHYADETEEEAKENLKKG